MTRKQKIENYNKEVKKQATIKVRTLLVAIAWVATVIAGIIFGWFIRSDFASEVRSEVKSQMVVVDLKDQK